MNWSGNFREGLAREIRENKTLAKITAYTVFFCNIYHENRQSFCPQEEQQSTVPESQHLLQQSDTQVGIEPLTWAHYQHDLPVQTSNPLIGQYKLFFYLILTGLFECIFSYPDNSPSGQFPTYRYWSWWVVLFRGSVPSGELFWWGIVIGIMFPVGNGWDLFLSGGELFMVGSCPTTTYFLLWDIDTPPPHPHTHTHTHTHTHPEILAQRRTCKEYHCIFFLFYAIYLQN